MIQAPPVDRFPDYPASWHLFGTSQELRQQPITKKMLGRQLVGFRTASGSAAILDARCVHQGADLGLGRVVGEALQCPFHNWEYGTDGRCVRIPAQPAESAIPSFAQQTAYPVDERNGYVFFFNGRQPAFPLPFLDNERSEDYVAGRSFRLLADCPWYMFSANAFDWQHWIGMHHRTPCGRPVIDCPYPWARRICFSARITGDSICDRLLRRFAGQPVEIRIVNYGGAYIVVEGLFPRVHSRMIITMLPPPPGELLPVDTIVLIRRSHRGLARALLQPIDLWLRRLFTHAFMKHEFDELRGIRYQPAAMIEADEDLVHYFHWIALLGEQTRPPEFAECNGRAAGLPALQQQHSSP